MSIVRRSPGLGAAPVTLALLAVSPATGRAQAVRVTAVDSASRQPVPSAWVALERADGARVASVVTNDRGEGWLAAPDTGRYVLVVRRLGFRPERSAPLAVVGDGVAATFVLAARPIALPTVLVTAEGVESPAGCVRLSDDAPGGALARELADAMRTAFALAGTAAADDTTAFEIRTFTRGVPVHARSTSGGIRYGKWTRTTGARAFTGAPPGVAYMSGAFGPAAVWHGPDETLFASARLAETHCFAGEPAAGGAGPSLRFAPLPGAPAPSIAGVVRFAADGAVPTVVEFRYTGIPWGAMAVPAAFADTGAAARRDPPYDAIPGGRLEFGRLPGGRFGLVRWTLRTPVVRDFAYSGRGLVALDEVGAEVRTAP